MPGVDVGHLRGVHRGDSLPQLPILAATPVDALLQLERDGIWRETPVTVGGNRDVRRKGRVDPVALTQATNMWQVEQVHDYLAHTLPRSKHLLNLLDFRADICDGQVNRKVKR